MDDRQRLIEIFKRPELKAIQYGTVISASEKPITYKIDAEPVLKHPEGREIIGRLVSDYILRLEEKSRRMYQIAGVYKGGAVVAELAAHALGRNHVGLDYKTGKTDGTLLPADSLICEDVTRIGSSITKCMYSFMIPKRIAVRNTISVVDREEGAAENLLYEFGITHHFFITKTELGITAD
jgi:orotate phosphoribosyltransferase